MFSRFTWIINLLIVILILLLPGFKIKDDIYIWEKDFVYNVPDLISDYVLSDSAYTIPWNIQFGKVGFESDKPAYLICNCVYTNRSDTRRPKRYSKNQYLDYLNLQGLLCEVNARELKKLYEDGYIYQKNFRDLRFFIDDSLWQKNKKFNKPSQELFKNMKYLTDSLNTRLTILDAYSNDKKLGVMVNWPK